MEWIRKISQGQIIRSKKSVCSLNISFVILHSIEMIDLERIINDFYSPSASLSVTQRQQLNQILECLQYSPFAWDFSWKLLSVNKSASVQFFGAVALCNKISKHLFVLHVFQLYFSHYGILFRSELDDNQIQQLSQQLIQRLIFYMSINSKQITTKLVVAVRGSEFNRSQIENVPRSLFS